jgi:hypothetical protein
VFDAVRELSEPYPDRTLEFYPKAGEGGSWIYRELHPEWGDPSHLAIDGPEKIDAMKRIGDVYGVKVIPYYVIRGGTSGNRPSTRTSGTLCRSRGG